MKKGIIGLLAGVIIGAAATWSLPAYGAAKQYMLTLFEKPVIVNGVKYADAANPILNYNGKTYIPLAKIGDLTGVPYTWNAAKKQVEIGKSAGTSGVAGRENDVLKPDTVIEEAPKTGYRGFSDDVDTEYTLAKLKGDPLPPRLSEGWITEDAFSQVYNVMTYVDKDSHFIVTTPNMVQPKELLRFTLPDGWKDKLEGDATTVEGIRIKKFKGTTYVNTSDLEKTGFVK